jgi:hypothetical protein
MYTVFYPPFHLENPKIDKKPVRKFEVEMTVMPFNVGYEILL